jgi:cyclic pyranopterin phosphate synthase
MPTIDYLRISLVDRCNFQCQYCMPEGADLQYLPQGEWLTRTELRQLLQEVFMPLGFSNFGLLGVSPWCDRELWISCAILPRYRERRI